MCDKNSGKQSARGGITGETGADVYTALSIEQITNEDPPCSAGHSTYRSVVACMGESISDVDICG